MSFSDIRMRRVVGRNIVISTEHHERIFALKDWNFLGIRAKELAHTKGDIELAIALARIL